MVNLQLIKKLADEKNILLTDIANELGITQQALSKIIRNNSTKIETLERIALILKVPVTIFFEDTKSNGDFSQKVYGDHNQVAGRDINLSSNDVGKLVDTVSKQQATISELIQANQAQTGRFMSIIEHLTK